MRNKGAMLGKWNNELRLNMVSKELYCYIGSKSNKRVVWIFVRNDDYLEIV